ncbi:MAG: IclR family transcriptional regulator [Hydrogenophaga sp.]|nr:IclR family transcriptional regulator [Hydrogenophaga sp.]
MAATEKKVKKEEEPLRVAVLDRALLLMDAFGKQPRALSLADLADLSDLHKSTILRLLISLEDFGYVRRRQDGLYTVGPTMFRLGTQYEKSQTGRAILLPALEALVQAGTESASFHVLDGERRLCLYRVDSHHSTLDTVAAGKHYPLEQGAAGRILRTYADDQGRTQGEPRFVVEISKGERDPACWAVAAPVYGRDNVLLGAISLSGPKERFTKANIAFMSQLLLDSARRCSQDAVSIRQM